MVIDNKYCVTMYNIDIGFVSNGEYNSMRANGYSRPLSVLQIKADARKKYSKMGKKSMVDMLTPKSMYIIYIIYRDCIMFTAYNSLYVVPRHLSTKQALAAFKYFFLCCKYHAVSSALNTFFLLQ